MIYDETTINLFLCICIVKTMFLNIILKYLSFYKYDCNDEKDNFQKVIYL